MPGVTARDGVGRLELRGLAKAFGATRALDGVSLEVGPGEILGITGPSGAGKSTLCRLVAGVETASAGDVLIDGSPVTEVPPERRRVALMFESYALYPHLSVLENVSFPLRAPGAPRRSRIELTERVQGLLSLVELEGLEARRPAQLSGGQRQRVALCRALAQEPRAYVLDEPLSHLDAKLRHVLRGAIRRRLARTEVPAIWTSPDALEAFAVADRVAVLIAGRIRQVGSPMEVYRRPATIEVARLAGDPPMNLLPGTVREAGGALRFHHVSFDLALSAALRARLEATGRREDVVLGIRPTEIGIASGDEGRVRGDVWVWEPFGTHGIASVRLGPDIVKVKVPRARSFRPGDRIALDVLAAEPAIFDGATGCAI
jgi:multiple sugar transport system ATP-binding protein